ncbi:hypothetical protein BSL78_23945 [Apostichopus japonicus]|uniref:Protein transport protein Sec61 subunit gamma n=1 Tax=Stichopus japonicus TaxID=307972 RepID=A0A2G8JTY2_STIJA|nr:hypothetical protein BSL78_23945 [Apostichopus japonicus]
MDQIQEVVKPAKDFIKDSIRLVKRCTKPDRKEFQKIAIATAIGFCIMGFIGFFVKLIHIPINNIIVLYSSGCKIPDLDNPDKCTESSCDNERRIMTRYPMRDELFEQHLGYHIVLTIGREQHQMYSNVIRTFEFGQY